MKFLIPLLFLASCGPMPSNVIEINYSCDEKESRYISQIYSPESFCQSHIENATKNILLTCSKVIVKESFCGRKVTKEDEKEYKAP